MGAMRRYPYNVNLFTKSGETIFFGVEDHKSTSEYIMREAKTMGGIVVFSDEKGVITTFIKAEEIVGFQLHLRNAKTDELVDLNLEIQAKRMEAEKRELDKQDDSQSWRGDVH